MKKIIIFLPVLFLLTNPVSAQLDLFYLVPQLPTTGYPDLQNGNIIQFNLFYDNFFGKDFILNGGGASFGWRISSEKISADIGLGLMMHGGTIPHYDISLGKEIVSSSGTPISILEKQTSRGTISIFSLVPIHLTGTYSLVKKRNSNLFLLTGGSVFLPFGSGNFQLSDTSEKSYNYLITTGPPPGSGGSIMGFLLADVGTQYAYHFGSAGRGSSNITIAPYVLFSLNKNFNKETGLSAELKYSQGTSSVRDGDFIRIFSESLNTTFTYGVDIMFTEKFGIGLNFSPGSSKNATLTGGLGTPSEGVQFKTLSYDKFMVVIRFYGDYIER